jgi:hypothetical protein
MLIRLEINLGNFILVNIREILKWWNFMLLLKLILLELLLVDNLIRENLILLLLDLLLLLNIDWLNKWRRWWVFKIFIFLKSLLKSFKDFWIIFEIIRKFFFFGRLSQFFQVTQKNFYLLIIHFKNFLFKVFAFNRIVFITV